MEIKNLLEKKVNKEQTIENIVIKTRQYAKRQATWARGKMKNLFVILVMMISTIMAKETRPPEQIIPFRLTYEDVKDIGEVMGQILVSFIVDESGKVIDAEILNTFDTDLIPIVLDKVLQMEFNPALQNGYPIRVKYNLPIVFK